jgi:hypothetical protein
MNEATFFVAGIDSCNQVTMCVSLSSGWLAQYFGARKAEVHPHSIPLVVIKLLFSLQHVLDSKQDNKTNAGVRHQNPSIHFHSGLIQHAVYYYCYYDPPPPSSSQQR